MGLFRLTKQASKKDKLLELQKIVLDNSPDRLIVSEKQLKELATKAANRDLEIIKDCIYILETTKKPETFFSRFDLFIAKAEHLRVYEEHLRFTASPSAAYGELWQDRQECIHNFLVRYFCDTLDQVDKLKTDKAKLNKYQKFYDSLQPYYEQMNPDNIDYIETKYRAYTRRLLK